MTPLALAVSGPFPAGSHSVIFGGEDSDDDAVASAVFMGTLRSVQQFFEGPGKQNITVDGVYNSPGMWVNNQGQYFIHETERTTAHGGATTPP